MTTAPTNRRSPDTNRAGQFCEETPCSLVRLSKGSAYRLPRHVREVRCVSGTIWMTRVDDSRDTVLIPGQALAVHGRGVVVQAIHDAVMRI